jgi:hypothetical protein
MRTLLFCGMLLLYALMPGAAVISMCTGGVVDAKSATVDPNSEYDNAFGVLEFRIAPETNPSPGRPILAPAQQVAQYRKDLAARGPMGAIQRNGLLVWIKIAPGVTVPPNLITDEYQGSQYLLVCNGWQVMMSSATGWGLKSVTKDTKDAMGRPAIGFQLDQVGGNRFYNLTSGNIDRAVAIVIEGKVVSAPSIATAVRSQAVITGDFTTKQIDDMTKVLQKIIRPVSTPTAIPISKPAQRPLRIYLIPILIFVLAVAIVGFFIYR